mgnify:CR=1 FL=1
MRNGRQTRMAFDLKKTASPAPAFDSPLRLSEEAERLSRAYPPLLIEADRVAHTVAQGLHGRRRAGVGETFWQFRQYRPGDETARIDWRRSGRSDSLFVRENEWEAANTVWLWVNLDKGMGFHSHLSHTTKAERAGVLTLALAQLMISAGERVGIMGAELAPSHHRLTLRRLAAWLVEHGSDPGAGDEDGLPPVMRLQRFSNLVLVSDFLVEPDALAERLSMLAARDVRGHLIQVLDPAEETLPYEGRKEFAEMGGPLKLMIGRTESLRGAYRQRLAAHRDALKELARRLGWSFTVHHTDQPPQRALLTLYGLMSGDPSTGSVRANG